MRRGIFHNAVVGIALAETLGMIAYCACVSQSWQRQYGSDHSPAFWPGILSGVVLSTFAWSTVTLIVSHTQGRARAGHAFQPVSAGFLKPPVKRGLQLLTMACAGLIIVGAITSKVSGDSASLPAFLTRLGEVTFYTFLALAITTGVVAVAYNLYTCQKSFFNCDGDAEAANFVGSASPA